MKSAKNVWSYKFLGVTKWLFWDKGEACPNENLRRTFLYVESLSEWHNKAIAQNYRLVKMARL